MLSLLTTTLPKQIRNRLLSGEKRFYASVNLGAEGPEQLRISNWEADAPEEPSE